MRVSSLSDDRVIGLLTKYFVPVWVSRDDYQLDPRSQREQAELERIDRERSKRRLKGGTVCVFVLNADGSVLATLPVQQAYKPENLLPFLTGILAGKQVTPRSAAAIRATAAEAHTLAPKTAGGRIVHVWTRCDQPGANRGLSHDRIELTAEECRAFAPAADVRPGASWRIPDALAHKLYQDCYPPGPIWNAKNCQVTKGSLLATCEADTSGAVHLRLEGAAGLRFPNTGKPTDGHITAHFVGVAHWDARKQALTSLALVSDAADYVWYWQGKPQPIKMRIALELEP